MPLDKQQYFDATKKPRGIKRLLLAMANSVRALRWVAQNESAFRQELVLLLATLILLTFWPVTLTEKALLVVSILFILFAEIVNTAIEATIDRVGFELHTLSGLAKDLGSAGVLVAVLIALITWGTVFFNNT